MIMVENHKTCIHLERGSSSSLLTVRSESLAPSMATSKSLPTQSSVSRHWNVKLIERTCDNTAAVSSKPCMPRPAQLEAVVEL